MKLYYVPGASSHAVHVLLRELGLNFELELVDLATRTTQTGANFYDINPNGYVPALVLGGGAVLTEVPAILQYLVDKDGPSTLAPATGTLERAQMQAILNFVSAEYHKAFIPLFVKPDMSDSERAGTLALLHKRFAYLESLLADGRDYLVAGRLSLADIYVYTVTSWSGFLGVSLSGFDKLQAHMGRIAGRESAVAARAAEGLG